MREFKNANGETLELGRWYNFGGNVSFRVSRHGKNGLAYAMREDETGTIHKPAGPAARDSLSMALYRSRVPHGYARYCMGADFKPEQSQTLEGR